MEAGESTIEFLSVGDLIGQAVRLFWHNALMILQVLLVPAIGCMVGKIFMHLPFVLFKADSSTDFATMGLAAIGALIGLCIFLYSMWLLMLRQFGLIKLFIAPRKNGEQPRFEQAYQEVKSMQGGIFAIITGSTLVSMVVAFISLIVIIITSLLQTLHLLPGWLLASLVLIEVVAMLLTVLLVSVVYWLALNEVILGGKRMQPAISEAVLLTWPNFWRVIYFMLLSCLVTILITWPLALPLVAFTVIEIFVKTGQDYGSQHFFSHIQDEIATFGTKTPFYRLVFAQAWETIISMVTWPIAYFAWALFYQDIKKRAFAPDLSKRLENIVGVGEAGVAGGAGALTRAPTENA